MPKRTVPSESSPNNSVDKISQEILRMESKLNSNIPTTLWISDLHGEGDRFKSILRGRFGLFFQTCVEALPKTFSKEKIQYLVKIIRRKEYFHDADIKVDKQDVILCLAEVVKYKITNTQYRIEDITLPEFREQIIRLISGMQVSDLIFEDEVISKRIVAHLAHTIKEVIIDGLMVLGDVFDRGPQPDKIIRFLDSKAYSKLVHYVFGNHDILWLGAVSGNRSLIAETLRITCRYDHFELMNRLGFDSTKLEKFAVDTYPAEKVTGKFKARSNRARSMEKALCVIQFKLEEECIKKYPDYEMQSRLWLEKLSRMLETGQTEGLLDTHFPTLSPDNPTELTPGEIQVIDDLVEQFKTNEKLKRLMSFFFKKGMTYHIHNNILNIHALIPSTKDGEFETFLGRKGKALLDWIQESIDRIGKAYLNNQPQNEDDQTLMFYLWCGPKSPFFGKVAMKTFERYFLSDEETHKEPSLYWNQNLLSDDFKQKIMKEFGTGRIIYGHTPVDVTKGKKMASEDGIAINVDGGFAAAYYNRGHALVHTPHQLYGIILPTPQEMKDAEVSTETVPLSVELIDEFTEPLKIKDTFKGRQIMKRRDKLLKELKTINGKS